MSTLIPSELRCEYSDNPLGLDTVQPRFSWILQSSRRAEVQTAYQILAATDETNLEKDHGNKWDSGKVVSSKSVNVPYDGEPLKSGEKCFWKIRVWDRDDKQSSYSTSAVFEMGLLQDKDWHGSWIGAGEESSGPLFRKEFALKKEIGDARIYIAGLGLYELYLNGTKVGDHVLDPALTDYRQRVSYVTYDVTGELQEGINTVGVMLGNGWFRDLFSGRNNFGDSLALRLQLNIEFVDGSKYTVCSDETWQTAAGPVVFNHLQKGEIYDARLEKPGWDAPGYADTGWRAVQVVDPPEGVMYSQFIPAMKVVETLKPVNFSEPAPGIYVFDFGQLFGGWVRARFNGPEGTRVTIKYSSRILPDGHVDRAPFPDGQETNTYILKGDPNGETYEPRFTFHPVHFVQIEGYTGELTMDGIEGRVIHSAIDLTGDFTCSNPMLNQIHEIVSWTMRNALKGFPLDCLHREPLAYNEPASVSSILFTRKYMPRFWTKWLVDIQGTQRDDGSVSDWAPEFPEVTRKHDAAQAGNYPPFVWYFYQYYDDKRILSIHYSTMKAWVDYLSSIADDSLITIGWLGDHMLPGKSAGREVYTSDETPPPLIWTGYYYRGALVVSRAAAALGESDDAVRYSALAGKIKDAINRHFFDENTDNYATGSQTSNAFPLVLGVVPEDRREAVVRNIVNEIMETHGGHIHTGHVGTASVIETLTKYGDGEAMYAFATAETYPGWGYMVKQGSTTVWESWGRDWAPDMPPRAHRADSMMMWGCIDKFFYHCLAGICEPDFHGPDFMAPGFEQFEIKPHVLGDLTSAAATVKTVRGLISSSWQRTGDTLVLEVVIPANSQAKVSIPTLKLSDVVVKESDIVIFKDGGFSISVDGVEGVTGVTAASDLSERCEHAQFVELFVGSGSYSFVLAGKKK